MGAAHNEPFGSVASSSPSGCGVELVEQHAPALDAEVARTAGGEEELVDQLEHGQPGMIAKHPVDTGPAPEESSSVAALVIATSVLKDGITNLAAAVAGLVDARPTTVDSKRPHPLLGGVGAGLPGAPDLLAQRGPFRGPSRGEGGVAATAGDGHGRAAECCRDSLLSSSSGRQRVLGEGPGTGARTPRGRSGRSPAALSWPCRVCARGSGGSGPPSAHCSAG